MPDMLSRDKYLDHDEFDRLIGAAATRLKYQHAQRSRALLLLSGLLGTRVSETTGLRFHDLNLESLAPDKAQLIRVRRRKKRQVGSKIRYDDVALAPEGVKALLAYLRELKVEEKRPWMRVFPISTRQAERVFKRYAKIAALSPRYAIHALRHYRGLTLYEQTGDANLVRVALGHESLTSTQVYIHTIDHLRKTGVDFKRKAG